MLSDGFENQMPRHPRKGIGWHCATFRRGGREAGGRTLRPATKAEQAGDQRNRLGDRPTNE